jgi:hypothetical protein
LPARDHMNGALDVIRSPLDRPTDLFRIRVGVLWKYAWRLTWRTAQTRIDETWIDSSERPFCVLISAGQQHRQSDTGASSNPSYDNSCRLHAMAALRRIGFC